VSESDSFIDEVTEEVRRDRLFALMRRYGWIGVLAVVLIVGGAGVNEWRKARAEARAQAFGDAVIAAMAAEDRAAALAAVPADGAQAGLVNMLTAAAMLEADDPAATRAALQAVAVDATQPETLRALAQLKLVMLQGAEIDPALRDATFSELAAPGAPFRLLAIEQQALVLLQAGDTDAAVARLQQLLQEPELTPGLQQRVAEVMVALGVDPAAQ
jgi:hypothetical protein